MKTIPKKNRLYQEKQLLTGFKEKRVVIMGLGLNQGGVGTARFLARAGAKVLVTDLKTEKELTNSIKQLKGLPIDYVLGRHRKKDFKNADLIIQNPGVLNNSQYLAIAKEHKIPIETDMGIFIRLCPSQDIIAVAGTKGKSTTACLIEHLFRAVNKNVILAGNIGISVLDSLPYINQETIVVLEISSWQLEGLKKHRFAPKVGILTNILVDHLDRYHSFRQYSRAEQLIYRYQSKDDFLVLNQEQKIFKQIAQKVKSKIIWFSKKKKILKITETSLIGEHNLDNVLAATTVAMLYNISLIKIRKALKNFKPVAHRLEFVCQKKGVRYYNDSTATTPDACLAALNSFGQPIILILGGKDKKMCFKKLIEEIAKNRKIKKIILLKHPAYSGSEKILKQAKRLKIINRFIIVSSIQEAVKISVKLAEKNDIVLLSPATASFGMFQNEFDRGRQFIKAVKELKHQIQNSKSQISTNVQNPKSKTI